MNMKLLKRPQLYWLTVSVLVLALDQLTKWMALQSLPLNVPQKILPVFNLTLAYNRGAAFSFLSDAGGWQRWLFTVIALSIATGLLVWMARLKDSDRVTGIALGLILGGAMGNLIDRLRYGYVIDFLQFHLKQYYWPVFNIADMAVVCGAFLVAWMMWRASD
jgi:signal peptidase II